MQISIDLFARLIAHTIPLFCLMPRNLNISALYVGEYRRRRCRTSMLLGLHPVRRLLAFPVLATFPPPCSGLLNRMR